MSQRLLLICGKSTEGKTTSLEGIDDHEGVLFANCEGKEIPFRNKFKEKKIIDPKSIPVMLDKINGSDKYHTMVVDTVTYMMDLYESLYIATAKDGRKAWGGYSQFFRDLMLQHCVPSDKTIIMLGHTVDVLNETTMEMETLVQAKGALKNITIESFFTNIVAAKRVPLKKLEGYENDLLTITEDEEIEGFKYVYQTRITKDTIGEKIRGPKGMWARNETFIDANAQFVINRLNEYYED